MMIDIKKIPRKFSLSSTSSVDDDAEVILVALFLNNNTTAIVKTVSRIEQIKNIILNAASGNDSSSPFTVTGTRYTAL